MKERKGTRKHGRRTPVTSVKEKVEIVSKAGLFEGLSKSDVRKIISVGKEVRHAPGAEIVREGEAGVGFHLILEGTGKVKVEGRTYAVLGPGAYFGELSLIDGGPRTATVVADGDMKTLSIPRWSFMPLLDKHPAITRKMLIEACSRLRSANAGPTD